MISADEMVKLLDKLYGIKSEKDLDRELEKLGGIDVALFTQERKKKTLSMAG